MRSGLSRCGSVEVISDVELTSSESVTSSNGRSSKMRKSRKQKTLSTIAFRSPLIDSATYSDNSIEQVLPVKLQTGNEYSIQMEWLKCHATTSDSILIISNGISYIIEHKLSLENAKIREIRYKGRGIIKLTLTDCNKIILLRYDSYIMTHQ